MQNQPHPTPSTRLGAAIGYALAYLLGMIGLYGAGALIAALWAMLDLQWSINPFGGMLIAAVLLALGYRQAQGAAAHE